MKRCAALIHSLALLTFIYLTSVSFAQFTPATGLENEKLNSRPSPAQIAKEPANALNEKGYVTIGQILVKEEGNKCWGDKCTASLDCSNLQPKKDFTRELLEKAASKGGDLVILSDDNAIAKGSISKNGKCVAKGKRTKDMPFQKCQSAYRDSTGTYRTGACTTEMKAVTVNECVIWETISGYSCSKYSAGTVLRLDPDLSRSIAAKAAENKARMEAISTRIGADAFVTEVRRDLQAPSRTFENGKWGYRDNSGKMSISAQFASARSFSEGLAMISPGDKWGFIDKTGNPVISPQFDVGGDGFSQGLAAVGNGPLFQWKWGYIDTKGEFVIPAQFDGVKSFTEGLAAAAVGETFKPDRWGYIDKTGKWVINPGFYEAREFSEGLAPVAIGDIAKRKWGYVNKDGDMTIKPAFDDALGFSEGLAPIAYGALIAEQKWGYIDKSGQVVIQAAFDKADTFSDGLARVQVGGKYGYIDRSGNLVIKPQFDQAGAFYNSEARVLVGREIANIDKSGQITTQAK